MIYRHNIALDEETEQKLIELQNAIGQDYSFNLSKLVRHQINFAFRKLKRVVKEEKKSAEEYMKKHNLTREELIEIARLDYLEEGE